METIKRKLSLSLESEDEIESPIEPEKSKPSSVEPEKVKNSSSEKQIVEPGTSTEIEDELCASYEGHLNAEEDEIRKFELHDDSDIESEDEEDFTLLRIRNKEDRFQRRTVPVAPSPADLPKNKIFIDDFTRFIIKRSKTRNEKSSTISLTTSLLFRHNDSFLEDQLKNKPKFSLDKLTCFNDVDNFIELKDPSSWIEKIAGEDGKQNSIRRKEMFKSYKRLIEYILKLHGMTDFDSDLYSIVRRDKIKDKLKDIHQEIDACKTWGNLQDQIDLDHREIKKAKETLNPDEKYNAANANQVYFNSQQFKDRMNKNQKIYDDAMATGKIGPRDFDTLGHFSRHLLTMTDRNRAAGYYFKNSDFAARKSVWLPKDHNKVKFDGVPDDYNMHREPQDGRKPDAWTMDLSADEEILKLGMDVDITILKLADDWLQKFRDIKMIKWEDMGKLINYL